MTTVTFNTLKFVKRLERAGIPREQAAAMAEALDTQLATKADLMDMENRLIKWGIGLAFGQIAVIATLVK
jgi:hypothetical protein